MNNRTLKHYLFPIFIIFVFSCQAVYSQNNIPRDTAQNNSIQDTTQKKSSTNSENENSDTSELDENENTANPGRDISFWEAILRLPLKILTFVFAMLIALLIVFRFGNHLKLEESKKEFIRNTIFAQKFNEKKEDLIKNASNGILRNSHHIPDGIMIDLPKLWQDYPFSYGREYYCKYARLDDRLDRIFSKANRIISKATTGEFMHSDPRGTRMPGLGKIIRKNKIVPKEFEWGEFEEKLTSTNSKTFYEEKIECQINNLEELIIALLKRKNDEFLIWFTKEKENFREDLKSLEKEAKKEASSMTPESFKTSVFGGDWKFILEFSTVLIIIFSLLTLASIDKIDGQEIATILAAIAGYVLGRNTNPQMRENISKKNSNTTSINPT